MIAEHLLGIILAVQNTMRRASTYLGVTATYYSSKLEGKTMANGQIYHEYSYVVAYNKLPINTYVRITNPANDRVEIAIVTDRKAKNGIDLSLSLYKALGLDVKKGSGKVIVQRLDDNGRETN